MSLKAKIEAVIYAAEEPVTLAQLATLFGAEAAQLRAERLFAQAGSSNPETEQETLIEESEAAPAIEPEGSAESASQDVATEESNVPGSPAADAAPQLSDSPTAVEVAASTEESTPTEPAADDEKRLARQRDREIREELRQVLSELMDEYLSSDRGMEIREIAGGYRVATKPEYHDAVRSFIKSLKPVMKLSLQALETLAVIAYKQPVTAPEVSEIRGVDSGGVLGSLMSRKLITTAGRKQVIGRPILYKTTREFLLRFGLKDVGELPSIEEFEKMAGELADSDVETESLQPDTASQLAFAGPDRLEDVEQAASAIEEADALEVIDEEAIEAGANTSDTDAVEDNAAEAGVAVPSASGPEDQEDETEAAHEFDVVAPPATIALDVEVESAEDAGDAASSQEDEIAITPADHSNLSEESSGEESGVGPSAHTSSEREI